MFDRAALALAEARRRLLWGLVAAVGAVLSFLLGTVSLVIVALVDPSTLNAPWLLAVLPGLAVSGTGAALWAGRPRRGRTPSATQRQADAVTAAAPSAAAGLAQMQPVQWARTQVREHPLRSALLAVGAGAVSAALWPRAWVWLRRQWRQQARVLGHSLALAAWQTAVMPGLMLKLQSGLDELLATLQPPPAEPLQDTRPPAQTAQAP